MGTPKNEVEVEGLKYMKRFISEDKLCSRLSEFWDDELLLGFVRGKKYDYKKAKECFQQYVNIRTNVYLDDFLNFNLPKILKFFEANSIRKLKHNDKFGRLVFYNVAGKWEVDKYPMNEALKAYVLLVDEIIRQEEVKNGITIIWDLTGYNLKRGAQFTPYYLYKGMRLFIKSTPISFKSSHYINGISLFRACYKLIELFLPEKLKSRGHFHSSDMESFYEHLPREVLPKCIGGNLTDEEAFDLEFEQRIQSRASYYSAFIEKLHEIKAK